MTAWFRTAIGIMFSLAVLAGPARAGGSKADMLEPVSLWNVDYAENYCTLQRAFGSQEHPLVFRINQFGLGSWFEITLFGTPLTPFYERSRYSIGFGSGAPLPVRPLMAKTEKKEPSILFSTRIAAQDRARQDASIEDFAAQRAADRAFAGQVDRVTLASGSRSLVLDTGKLEQGLQALDKCMDSLLRAWNLEPQVQRNLSSDAAPVSMIDLVRSIQADYPIGLWTSGKQGRVNIFALIDAGGMVTRCETSQSYNDKAFDALACAKMRKAKFTAARDAAGKPVASYFTTTVIYQSN